MAFKMRTSKPGAGNKYYITKEKGGYSRAIEGKPTDSECNVLANCVGYAYGRFNEIGGYGSCKYLAPVNAENFMSFKGSCKTGQTPKLGACMVWRKGTTLSSSDGAGHVAIVEKVVSSTEVITSESGYRSSKPFWTQTRKKGSGNWGAGSAYTFLGFIYNPAVSEKDEATSSPASSSKPNTTLKYAVGDIVNFAGSTHYKSADASSGSATKASKAKITAVSAGSKHPYHCRAVNNSGTFISGVYGWVDEKFISSLSTAAASTTAIKVGDKVKLSGKGTIYGTTRKFASWVYKSTLYVREIDGSRVVVSTVKSGAVTGAVDKKYLSKA